MKLTSVLFVQIILLLCCTDSYRQHRRYEDDESHYGRLTRTASSRKVIVRMPSGKKYRMSDPDVSMNTNCDAADFVEVDPSRKEYEVIKREISSQLRVTIIHKIQKIINSCVWERYAYNRDVIRRQSGVGANETFLFASDTGGNNLTDIPHKGYDERLSTVYPEHPIGLYFIVQLAQNSEFPKGNRYIYMSRVSLGNVYYTDVKKTMAHPPIGYQSIGLGAVSPRQTSYIITKGEQIYPEYRIDFET